MEKQVITINERYYCAYIPSARSQKYAFDEVTGPIKVTIPSLTSEEAPVAFRLSDYSHKEENNTEIRWYQGKCWKRCTYRHTGGEELRIEWLTAKDAKDEIRVSLPYGYGRSREFCQKKYREAANGYILVDGYLWRQCGEPRYVIHTFGLGYNHGGTALSVDEWYNDNICRDRYFSALDGDKAVSEANRIAERRGDTESVGRFTASIEVLIPEAVTIRPIQEHGEGDPFMNKINAITEAAPDSTTAGLLAIMATAQEISK